MVNLINGRCKNAPAMTSLSANYGPRNTCGDGVGQPSKRAGGRWGHAEGGRHLRSAANLMRYLHARVKEPAASGCCLQAGSTSCPHLVHH